MLKNVLSKYFSSNFLHHKASWGILHNRIPSRSWGKMSLFALRLFSPYEKIQLEPDKDTLLGA